MVARICLVTPGHLSTNPRLVKEADALAAAGYEVTVVAARYQDWACEADKAFETRAWRRLPPVSFGPLAPPARRALQLVRHKAARLLTGMGGSHPALHAAAFHQVAPDLVSAVARVPADLYIAHYPAALRAAALAARRTGAAYAFDAEDFHLGEPPSGPEGQAGRRRIEAVERAYLADCAYVTAASPGIADAYVEAYGLARPSVLLNVFPRSEAPAASTPAGWATPAPSVYWFSQTIGPDRGLECAVRAIGRARTRPCLHLRGHPASGFRATLETIASEAGVADRLLFLPMGSPDDMVGLASAFDVGLVGETGHSHNRRIALTNKQFTYLLAGLPSLMSDVPAHQAFAQTAGGAARLYETDDPDSLAQAMDDVLGDPLALAARRAEAHRLGQARFNWDTEQSILLTEVQRALSPSRKAAP